MSAFANPLTSLASFGAPRGVAHGTLTVSTSPVALSSISATFAAKISSSGGPSSSTCALRVARISVETQPIRFTTDGTAPSTTVGHLLAAGDYYDLVGHKEIQGFQANRQGGADGTIMVTLYE